MEKSEFVKGLYDIVDPLLNGQDVVGFDVDDTYDKFGSYRIRWYNRLTGEIFVMVGLVDDRNGICEYWMGAGNTNDEYDTRFNIICSINSNFSTEHGHIYDDFDGIEKSLRTFTEWLVKTVV